MAIAVQLFSVFKSCPAAALLFGTGQRLVANTGSSLPPWLTVNAWGEPVVTVFAGTAIAPFVQID